jgi:hypothetical protein
MELTNHTHQLSNFRVNNNSPIQLSPDNSLTISGILNVGTAGIMHGIM